MSFKRRRIIRKIVVEEDGKKTTIEEIIEEVKISKEERNRRPYEGKMIGLSNCHPVNGSCMHNGLNIELKDGDRYCLDCGKALGNHSLDE